MEYTKSLQNCTCGNLPKLVKSPILGSPIVSNYRYTCETCDISTFGTKDELCCRELWNAAVERKNKTKIKQNEYKI